MLVLGIDPGASGALAFYDTVSGALRIEDMPTAVVERSGKNRTEPAPHRLAAIIAQEGPDAVWLEKVGAMPGQGVSSMFAFGRAVGVIEGVVASLGIRIEYVQPQVWQRATRCRGGKDGNCLRACELFPVHAPLFRGPRGGWLDGRADAALIAYYGSRA